jgi:hypothetical protein
MTTEQATQKAIIEMTRIWNDVIKADKSMARFADVYHLIKQIPLLVYNFAGDKAKGQMPTDFFIRVQFDPRIGGWTERPPKRTQRKGIVTYVSTSHVDTNFEGDFDGQPGYGALLAGLKEPLLRERRMSHQLLHELIHARIALEKCPEWPSDAKDISVAYDAFMEAAKRDTRLAAARDDVHRLITAAAAKAGMTYDFEERLGDWLDEKYVAQLSFSMYGVDVTNDEVANSVTRPIRRILSNTERARLNSLIAKLFNQIDVIHGKPKVLVPGCLEWSGPANRPLLPSWWHPLPSPNAFGIGLGVPTLIAPMVPPRYVPPPIPNYTPPPMPKYTPPPAPKVTPYVAPVLPKPPWETQTRPPAWNPPDNNPFARGRPDNTPPSPSLPRSRPEPIRPGPGPGWDPDRFGFGGGAPQPVGNPLYWEPRTRTWD